MSTMKIEYDGTVEIDQLEVIEFIKHHADQEVLQELEEIIKNERSMYDQEINDFEPENLDELERLRVALKLVKTLPLKTLWDYEKMLDSAYNTEEKDS